MVHAPAWLDLGSAWLEAPHALDARAVTPATVAEVPLDAMLPMVEHRATLARPLISALARQVRDLTLNTHELMHKDAPARLAAWLRQRCAPRPGMPGQSVVQLHERKRDIASQLAITPETLSRLMRSFMQQGVIEVSGYTVLVLDCKALERLARDDGAAASPA
jgi:CRP-like cAMP-binding protein